MQTILDCVAEAEAIPNVVFCSAYAYGPVNVPKLKSLGTLTELPE